MIVKWIVCYWLPVSPSWLPNNVLLLFCEFSSVLLWQSCSLKSIFVHSSWETACCESYPSAPQNLLKVQDLLLLTRRVVLCLCPKATTLSSIHIYPHSPSPNQCMCSIVVVTAMVASTVTSVRPGHYKPQPNQIFLGYFPKLSTWLCDLMGAPVIAGSQTVPVITFIQFSFWKTNKTKNPC